MRDDHFKKLKEQQDKRDDIETETRDQWKCLRWKIIRKILLTASNYAAVSRLRPTTSCKGTVKKVVYPKELTTPAMQYGLKHKSDAIAALEKILKMKIEKCGLFIDSEHAFLASTPYRIINDGEGVVEVKTSLQAKDLMVEEAIIQCKSLKTIFVHKNGEYQLSTRHHYYYQVQGQLHITQRKYCIFALWTPKSVINV